MCCLRLEETENCLPQPSSGHLIKGGVRYPASTDDVTRRLQNIPVGYILNIFKGSRRSEGKKLPI